MTRAGFGIFRKRTRCASSASLLIAIPSSILPLGDEPRGGAQHLAPGAEDRERGIGARQQIAQALFGAIDPELGDEGGLAQCGVLTGLFAERCGVALDVEQIVSDLEGFAERAAVIVERLIFLWRGLPQDRA